MDSFLTNTCDHKNNPTGAVLATVATGILCTPVDPLDRTAVQAYPQEKLFLMRQVFMKYTAFQPGDYLVSGGVTYAVRAVHPWESQGGLDDFYQVIVEKQLGG